MSSQIEYPSRDSSSVQEDLRHLRMERANEELFRSPEVSSISARRPQLDEIDTYHTAGRGIKNVFVFLAASGIAGGVAVETVKLLLGK